MRLEPHNVGSVITDINLGLSPTPENLRLTIDGEKTGAIRTHNHICIISREVSYIGPNFILRVHGIESPLSF